MLDWELSLCIHIFGVKYNIYWERDSAWANNINEWEWWKDGRRPAERDRLLRREILFVDSIIGGVASRRSSRWKRFV